MKIRRQLAAQSIISYHVCTDRIEGTTNLPLTFSEVQRVLRATANTTHLLQLDEIWTVAAADVPPPDESTDRKDWFSQLDDLVLEMHQTLEVCSDEANGIAALAEEYADEAEETLNNLLWSDLLNPSDLESLRWWTGRHGGFSGMAARIATIQTEVSEEHSALDQQLEVLHSGRPSAGDLSKNFRCGLTQQLMVGGILAFPVAGAGGIATAVTAGVVAGAAVASTGGVGAIVIIGAALLWARRYRC